MGNLEFTRRFGALGRGEI